MRVREIVGGSTAALLLASCAPSIETQIASAGAGEIPEKASFVFMSGPGTDNTVNVAARNLVADSLYLKNWKEEAPGTYAISVSVSVLPSSLDVHENDLEQGETNPIVTKRPKKNYILGSCTSELHRLDVKIFRVVDGERLYSGTASEYHCKARIMDTLPYLTNAAMADIGKLPAARTEKRKGVY